MAIEENINNIQQSQSEVEKTLKGLNSWKIKHEKEDAFNFGYINDLIKTLPTKADIVTAVAETVDVKINGKLITIEQSNTKIKEHLSKQDVTLKELGEKIQPFDETKKWFNGLIKSLAYLAAIVGSVTVIAGGIWYLTHLK